MYEDGSFLYTAETLSNSEGRPPPAKTEETTTGNWLNTPTADSEATSVRHGGFVG